ncbi:hypothetical protein TRFO_23343 [Tritrichomonas foetus]|uniref:Uncharacterized protein n=1 Tax=Tritrichomonas foetus TaxID=1144522 RepID=A0A1J4KF30_9EUKA|nr:hypothetical protein TRFO_23343 [Tritrichomonas foetus]|eukprot:OHT08198.1 hypothetical protein TRFO_23343 [Tritrichomonas foetus]
MKIEVNIEPELEQLFKTIGLTDEEIDNEYEKINIKVQNLFSKILADISDEVSSLTEKVENVENELISFHKKIGNEDSLNIDTTQNLKYRYDYATNTLANLKKDSRKQISNYDNLFVAMTRLFNILEIEDRRSFGNRGEDCSQERIDQTAQLVDTMTEIVTARNAEMDELMLDLEELHELLKMDPPVRPKTLSDKAFQEVQQQRDQLDSLYEELIAIKKRNLQQIRQAEKIFEKEPADFDESECVNQEELDILSNYLNELEAEKSTQIPEFIEKIKHQIEDLWDVLNMRIPYEDDFPEFYSQEETPEVLQALENEACRLENIKDQTVQIRKLLVQRDRIINDSKKKPSKALSISQIVANGKKMTVDLPILNGQLQPLLQEYLDNNGGPFLWGGKDLLPVVSDPKNKMLEKVNTIPKRYVSKQTSPAKQSSPSKLSSSRSPASSKQGTPKKK